MLSVWSGFYPDIYLAGEGGAAAIQDDYMGKGSVALHENMVDQRPSLLG